MPTGLINGPLLLSQNLNLNRSLSENQNTDLLGPFSTFDCVQGCTAHSCMCCQWNRKWRSPNKHCPGILLNNSADSGFEVSGFFVLAICTRYQHKCSISPTRISSNISSNYSVNRRSKWNPSTPICPKRELHIGIRTVVHPAHLWRHNDLLKYEKLVSRVYTVYTYSITSKETFNQEHGDE